MGFLDKVVFRGQTSDVKKGKDLQREREVWGKARSEAGQQSGQQAEKAVEQVPEPAVEQASEQGVSLKSKLCNEAEALRKAGRVHEAELKYLDSIKEEEKEAPRALWRQTGPAPAKYDALANMYYNTNRDELALEIMDKYLSHCKNCGKDDLRMKKLRASMADGSLKRMLIKGWAYSVGDPEAGQAQ